MKKSPDYSADEGFLVTENGFDPSILKRNDSVFTLGNGTLGFRGDFEEGFPGAAEGVYLNGFYESTPIHYGESAYGYARNGQTMLNLANAKRIRIFLDDEELCLAQGEVLHYQRALFMKEGVLRRCFEWHSPQGRAARVCFERIVCLRNPNLAYIRCEVESLSNVQCVRLESAIDAHIANAAHADDPRVGSNLDKNPLETVLAEASQGSCLLVQRTRRSALAYACATRTRVTSNTVPEEVPYVRDREAGAEFSCRQPKNLILEKWIAYTHGTAEEADTLAISARTQADMAAQQDANSLYCVQRADLDVFWRSTGLLIQGDPRLLQGLRFSLFQLYQSAGRDGKTNIAAKGLSGEGYEGHYFWDTEIYIFPLFLYTMPAIARELLCYRYSILEHARRRARELGHPKGALFPWRTIGGEECSAYYPAGTAQYHINADITNAVCQYVQATGDEAFMEEYGVEILVETARLWLDLGFYNPEKDGCFCINGVTGPDEYNVMVNNNCYTNLMAAYNLSQAADWMEWLEQTNPDKAKALFARLSLCEDEIPQWRKAAEHMYLPHDKKRNIHLQDDAFAERVPWPLEMIPQENFPLLLHYHPLVIYRHQVCKQADLVLALLLRGEHFSTEEKKRIFDYYEPLATHDSSLSKAIFSIIASEIGYSHKAYAYFEGAARLDLEDLHGNTQDGLHMASMGGTWLSVVYGFAGMRTWNGELSFCPKLPDGWTQYEFCVCWRGSRLRVSITQEHAVYTLTEGERMTFLHNGRVVCVTDGQPVRIMNADNAET